jgi:hypothetical protein
MKSIAKLLIAWSLYLSWGVTQAAAAIQDLDVQQPGGQTGNNDPATTGIRNPVIGDLGNNPEAASTGVTFGAYLITIWQALTVVGGLALLLYLLWGSIDWLVAGGDSGKVQKARDKMTGAVIGFIILLGSFVIIGFIGELIGYDLLDINLPRPGGA